MNRFRLGTTLLGALLLPLHTLASAQTERGLFSGPMDTKDVAREQFGGDAPWYLENIPFLDIDDPAIKRTYYYRWQVYRSSGHR